MTCPSCGRRGLLGALSPKGSWPASRRRLGGAPGHRGRKCFSIFPRGTIPWPCCPNLDRNSSCFCSWLLLLFYDWCCGEPPTSSVSCITPSEWGQGLELGRIEMMSLENSLHTHEQNATHVLHCMSMRSRICLLTHRVCNQSVLIRSTAPDVFQYPQVHACSHEACWCHTAGSYCCNCYLFVIVAFSPG